MSKEYVSPFTWAGMRRHPSVIPVIGCVAVGCAMATAYTIKLTGPTPEATLDSRKKRQPSDDTEDNSYKHFMSEVLQQLISYDRRAHDLERNISQLRDELRDARSTPQAKDVFGLSQIIQANNIANQARFEEQRQSIIQEQALKYRPIINNIKELEAHLESQRQLQLEEAPARRLWLACQTLLDSSKPLSEEPAYKALKQFAAEKNPLASNILDSIPAHVLKYGIPSEQSLVDRFNKLERVCKRVAMVDTFSAGITKYLMSYVLSLFVVDNIKVPEDEINGKQLVDPTSWNTFDILARVRYCLSHNDLEQAVRYANQLRGQSRVVARDWIRDARVHLATRQALGSIQSLVCRSSLLGYVQPNLNNNMAT